MVTGKELRNAIREKGFTMETAANQLDMSRQNLYYQTNKSKVDEDVLDKVMSKLGITFDKKELLQTSNNEKEEDTFKVKYYQLLEDQNNLLKGQVIELQKELKEIKANLDDIVKNQLTLDAGLQAAQEVILRKLSKDEKEYDSLIDSAYNTAIEHVRANNQKGNRLLVGS